MHVSPQTSPPPSDVDAQQQIEKKPGGNSVSVVLDYDGFFFDLKLLQFQTLNDGMRKREREKETKPLQTKINQERNM